MNEERGWLSAVLFFYSLAKICAQKMKKRLFSGILLAVTPGILSSSCIKMTKPEEGFAAISAAISPSREVCSGEPEERP